MGPCLPDADSHPFPKAAKLSCWSHWMCLNLAEPSQEAAAGFECKQGKHTSLCSFLPPPTGSDLSLWPSSHLNAMLIHINSWKSICYQLNLRTQLSPLEFGEVSQHSDCNRVPLKSTKEEVKKRSLPLSPSIFCFLRPGLQREWMTLAIRALCGRVWLPDSGKGERPEGQTFSSSTNHVEGNVGGRWEGLGHNLWCHGACNW